jgi:hypothetical protein
MLTRASVVHDGCHVRHQCHVWTVPQLTARDRRTHVSISIPCIARQAYRFLDL